VTARRASKASLKVRLPGQNVLWLGSHLVDCTLHHIVLFLTRYSYIHISSIRHVSLFPSQSPILGDQMQFLPSTYYTVMNMSNQYL
jgi:hypothetical protein